MRETVSIATAMLSPPVSLTRIPIWIVLPVKGHDNLKMPFTAQGITTFIAGNCGYGAAGYKRNSEHMDKVGFVTKDLYDVKWYTMENISRL